MKIKYMFLIINSQLHSLQGFSMLQHVSEFPSFLRLNDISLLRLYHALFLPFRNNTFECTYFLQIHLDIYIQIGFIHKEKV